MASPRLTFHVPSECAPDKTLPLLKVIYEEKAVFASVKDLQIFAKEHGLSKVDPKVKTRKPKFKVPFTPCLFNIGLIR